MVGILSSGIMEEESKVCKEQNPNIPPAQARVSERLRLKKRRKELAVKAKVAETQVRAIELTQVPIQHGNPAHKILFLTRLGLTPKAGVQLPPYLQIDRLSAQDVDAYKNSSSSSFSSELDSSETSDTDHSTSDINEEDLDLELLISPADIPEFFNEFFKKKPKKSRKNKKVRKVRLPPPTTKPVVRASNNNNNINFRNHNVKPRISMYQPHPAAVNKKVTQPLYREAFNRVNSHAARNTQQNAVVNGRAANIVRAHFLNNKQRIQMLPGKFTAQIIYEDTKQLDNIRQRLLNYNTVLEFAE